MIRPRESGRVREDAVELAVRKAVSGCNPCAQSYFDLARREGATLRDIERTVVRLVPRDSGLTRRDILRLAMAGAGGTAAVAAGILPIDVLATSYWWGTDSNTASCCGMPQGFYIGRLGGQTSMFGGAFNTTAASNAGYNATYEYWDVSGGAPGGPKPSGESNYQWGKDQANAAWQAWSNSPYASYVGGKTIFADVEDGNGGWNDSQGNNQQVIQGWADFWDSNTSFNWGIYISPCNWSSFFGTGFTLISAAGYYGVLWITGCLTCSISCAPCNNNCSTTMSQVESSYWPTAQNVWFGTNGCVIGQYWISNCADNCGSNAGDYNVMTTSPTPSNHKIPTRGGGSVWSCSGCGSGCSGC